MSSQTSETTRKKPTFRADAEWVNYTIALLSLVLVWEGVGQILQPTFLPPFTQVFGRLLEELAAGELPGFLASSLTNLLIGFVLGAGSGVVLGLLMGLYKPVGVALEPYVYGFMTAPSVVFVPIYFTIFGLSRWSIVALIIQYTIFVVAVNTMTAVKQVDREILAMSRVFGASHRQRIWHVIIPAALPLTMAGLRIGAARSLKGMVNGELLIALIGIGGQLVLFGNVFDAEGVLAIVLLIVIVSLIILRLLWYVDRHLTSWVPTPERV